MADYCGESPQQSILGSMSHGWLPDLDPGVGMRRMRFAPFFVWNARLLEQAIGNGVPNVHCIGAPFNYLVRDRFPGISSVPGRGTIVFPAHSAEGVISYAVDDFIDRIQREMPGPYTVSIYIQDAKTPAVDAYRRAGFRLVSFGPRMMPTFLIDLATEIAAHEAVVSNVAQTSIWYGAVMGRSVRVIGSGAYPVAPGQEPEGARLRWPALFDRGVGTADTVRLGEEELGADFVLEPAALRDALGLSSWWKARGANLIRGRVDARLARSARSSGSRIDGLGGNQPVH